MIALLTILHYFIATVVDVLDKFLLTKRKIEPISYTFYTVVSGLILLGLWPLVYAAIPTAGIVLAMVSGVAFTLSLYVFFRALSEGEASRVVPFVFGLVPVFDVLFSTVTGKNILVGREVLAFVFLAAGAMLIGYRRGGFWGKHVLVKLLAALLWSAHNALWQIAAESGPVLNSLMWNRIGAAGILVALLVVPAIRKKVFSTGHIRQKAHTTGLFLFKQMLGGVNFVFYSYLIALGNIALISALQGFRYVFLLALALVFSHAYRKILDERLDRSVVIQKVVAVGIIFIGTVLLFM